MPITSGSITVLRRVNTGDYSHKEVKAELHYVAEGVESIGELGDHARVEALTQVTMALCTVVKLKQTPELVIDGEICRITEPTCADVAIGEQGGEPLYGTSPAAGAVAEQKSENEKRRRRTKAQMEAARAAENLPNPNRTNEEISAAGPMQPADVSTPAGLTSFASQPVAPAEETWATGPLKEITDKELTEACNLTMGRVHDANKIRALIAEYTDGPSVAGIEQSDRAKFLDRLLKL